MIFPRIGNGISAKRRSPIYRRGVSIERANRNPELSSTQKIILSFVVLIVSGTFLLRLPAASRSGERAPFMTALFTAFTTVCVNGTTYGDIVSQWSGFGQAVLVLLMEIGGLGYMSAAALLFIFFKREFNMEQRIVMAEMLNLDDIGEIEHHQHQVLQISILTQLLGALILMFRFIPEFGLGKAAWYGVFHAVSAFSNCGIDLFGEAGITRFTEDPVVLLTLSVLIIFGGLGFVVIAQVNPVERNRRKNLYTKLVIYMTVGLILGGTLAFGILEWNNPETLGGMSLPMKLLNAFFESVTCRSAGMASFSQNAMSDSSEAIAMLLMLIGGSSNSTAGGVKTVTLAILLLYIRARLRSRNRVVIAGRTISNEQVLDAMTLTGILCGLSLFGGFFINHSSRCGLGTALFTAVSTLTTTGFTYIPPTLLSLSSQILLLFFMFFGRIGVLSISMSFFIRNRAEERISYPNAKLLIG